MIDRSAKVTRLKEVDRVEVGDIQTPTVGSGTISRVLLNMETKETDVNTILLLEGEDGSRLVGEAALHQTFVHEFSFHFGFHLDGLLANKNNPNVDFANFNTFLLQEVLHPRLHEVTQPSRWEVLGSESMNRLSCYCDAVKAPELVSRNT